MVRAKDPLKRTLVAGGRRIATRKSTLEVVSEESMGCNEDRVSRSRRSNGIDVEQDAQTMPSQHRGLISSGGIPRNRSRSRPRYRTKVRAQQEIQLYQHSTKLLIPKKQMQCVVREVVTDQCPDQEYRFSADALDVIHEAAEAFLVRVFTDASMCASQSGRVTLMPRDIQLVRMLQNW